VRDERDQDDVEAVDTRKAVEAWAEHDAARAIHPADRAAIAATEAARALVVLLAEAGGDPRDLYTACATLGRLLAEAGASPTLASATMDGARAAALRGEPLRDEAALRASVLEGFTAGIVAAQRAAARGAWDWPACAIALDAETCAIAAGHPDEPDDARVAWAETVASRASKAGVRRAIVGGDGRARAEVEAALRLVGIEVVTRLEPEARSWLPWRRPRGGK
jgi:hypothetical protein